MIPVNINVAPPPKRIQAVVLCFLLFCRNAEVVIISIETKTKIFFISIFNFHVKTIRGQGRGEIVSMNDMKMTMNPKDCWAVSFLKEADMALLLFFFEVVKKGILHIMRRSPVS
jgi:hypothetical protein